MPCDAYVLKQVGILAPEPHPTGRLHCGQVGYVISGIKSIKAVRVGDTLHHFKRWVRPHAVTGVSPSAETRRGLGYAIDG